MSGLFFRLHLWPQQNGERMSETDKELPLLTLDLVEAIEELFPDRCPEPSWPMPEVWMKAGQAYVARYLRAAYEAQNQEEELGN